ncbi:hypothetical protein CEQ21_21355 [Niallia circulans]|uniref:Uncharacterized protein n=1 Tax=Niallia circulans TaxID=1397 RepID=A0A553SLV6_NIACI|nr:hypothetical protein CEQ21_21355 [Niallia circulans]
MGSGVRIPLGSSRKGHFPRESGFFLCLAIPYLQILQKSQMRLKRKMQRAMINMALNSLCDS